MDEIVYTQASEPDIPALVDLRIAFLTELSGAQPDAVIQELREGLYDCFSEAFATSTYICWLAKAGDELAGTGGMVLRQQPGNFKNPSGRVGYIMSMYTVPAFRKRGISTGMLDRLIAAGQGIGITAFELHATEAGIPVYERNGFSRHTEPTYRKYVRQALSQ